MSAGRKNGAEELRRFAEHIGLQVKWIFHLGRHSECPPGWWAQDAVGSGPQWLGTTLAESKAALNRIRHGRQQLRIIGLPNLRPPEAGRSKRDHQAHA